MQNKLIVVSFRDFEGKTQLVVYQDANAAKIDILKTLRIEAHELDAENYEPEKESAMQEFLKKMFASSGTASVETGWHEHSYELSFRIIPAEYRVSDDEFYLAMDAYCNSSRSATDFKNMAERIATNMHRYCQSELWKFFKKVVSAFASHSYDERNETAHNEAQNIDMLLN